MRNKKVFLFFVLLLNTSNCIAQTLHWDLIRKQKKASFKLSENTHQFRAFLGPTFALFDNPVTFTTIKYSQQAIFRPRAGSTFGIEYISNFPVVAGFTLSAGFYYMETDFIWDYKVDNYLGLTFHGMPGYVSNASFGVGLNKQIQLRGRWYFEYTAMATFDRNIYSAWLTDSTANNAVNRVHANGDKNGYTDIFYPIGDNARYSVKLKNQAIMSFFVSKRIALQFSAVYNIGLPNKMFILQFDQYSNYDMKHPLSHEKVVVSNSSYAFIFGLKLALSGE